MRRARTAENWVWLVQDKHGEVCGGCGQRVRNDVSYRVGGDDPGRFHICRESVGRVVEFKLPDEPPESKLLFEVCSVDGCDSARVVEGDTDTAWHAGGKSYLLRLKEFYRVRVPVPCEKHNQIPKV